VLVYEIEDDCNRVMRENFGEKAVNLERLVAKGSDVCCWVLWLKNGPNVLGPLWTEERLREYQQWARGVSVLFLGDISKPDATSWKKCVLLLFC
jgi:hypothetical protein